MGITARMEHVLLAQRGHLFPWAPVFLALGIGGYFALRFEPELSWVVALAGAALVLSVIAMRWHSGFAPLVWAVALMAAGFALASARAHWVAAPVLDWRYYGPIEGRIVKIDRSASDALRLTLDEVKLDRVGPRKTPRRARISLHGKQGFITPMPGQRVMTTGHLSPPQGPVEPGGFDFRLTAWFQGLGAVGYTRNPVLLAAPGEGGLWVLRVRMAASARVREVLPGDVGGFAAAVTTGDRSGVGQSALDALRASNLAHLLAISGLHMGLLAGFVFAVLRIGMTLVPAFALRAPVRKLAAGGALVAAACYLALSGGNVATERAFIMVAVALGALLVDRRAISMRAVAMAALIVLMLRPEALLGPGFQMSFAATTALVAVFGWIRDAPLPQVPGWARPVLGVVISSAVAGAATAPVGAAHFNTLAQYGLLANLASVPLMGTLVIPAAVLAALLAPFGLETLGLWIMGLGLRWILAVAHWVTGLEGAQSHVASPAQWVLPVMALGALWLILWQGRARLAGPVAMALALAFWAEEERPGLLIADNGGLIGVMTQDGRALSKARGAGFVAMNWLENDGDGGAAQIDAAGRWPGAAEGRVRRASIAGHDVIHVIGKRAASGLSDCKSGQIVVSSVPLDLSGPCEIYDPLRLRETGSLALTKGGLISSREWTGERLWTR